MHKPLSTLASLLTSLYNFCHSLIKFFYTDGMMYLTGKAYKPTDPSVAQKLIHELRPLIGASEDSWTFVDLGCGQGALLPSLRAAKAVGGQPMFQSVVGVELDVDTHRQAVRKVGGDPAIKVVCGDMFEYVRSACAQKRLLSGRAVFYMYEPLWAANMAKAMRDELYGELLAAVGGHEESIVVYVTGVVQMHERHIEQAAFAKNGLALLHQQRVNQSGAANKLSATYNTMEIWRVAPPKVKKASKANAKSPSRAQ